MVLFFNILKSATKKILFFLDICNMHHQGPETIQVGANHFRSTSIMLWGCVCFLSSFPSSLTLFLISCSPTSPLIHFNGFPPFSSMFFLLLFTITSPHQLLPILLCELHSCFLSFTILFISIFSSYFLISLFFLNPLFSLPPLLS